jgi:acetyl esterase/lipase
MRLRFSILGGLLAAALSVACRSDIASVDNNESTAPSPDAPAPSVRSWTNVAYASQSAAQRLDLYLPANGAGPFPVVLWVHGGGWQGGSRELGPTAFQRRLLERGMALATVGYRLSGEAIWPAQIHDLKAAVRWLRANADRHALDTSRIGAWGSSAGGHLVAMLGTTGQEPTLEGALGNAAFSSRVHAVVDWYGPTDLLAMDAHARSVGCPTTGHNLPNSPESRLLGGLLQDRIPQAREASPVTWVSADDAVFLLQHGSADCTVPWPQSAALHEALRAQIGAARVTYERLEGAGHGGPQFTGTTNVDKVLAFFAGQFAR